MWLLTSPFLVARLCSVSRVLRFLPVSPWRERGFDASILEMPKKAKIFGIMSRYGFSSCQILQPGSYLDMTTALGLTPDSSSFKLHINFCCLITKNFIWICRSKECFPIHNNFLFYLRHIYQLENKTTRNTKEWKPFFSSLGLVS